MALVGRMRQAMRVRHYSPRTEAAYVQWVKRYLRFHGLRQPAELGEAEVAAFLSDLAVRGRIGAGTQNQALAALLFLYRDVLGRPLGSVVPSVRAKDARRLPVVLTRAEVRAVLREIDGQARLVAGLLHGSGLRLLECLRSMRLETRSEQSSWAVTLSTRQLTGCLTPPFTAPHRLSGWTRRRSE